MEARDPDLVPMQLMSCYPRFCSLGTVSFSVSCRFALFHARLARFIFAVLVGVEIDWLVGWLAGWMAGWLVGWAVEVEALIRWFGEGRWGHDRWACGTEELTLWRMRIRRWELCAGTTEG